MARVMIAISSLNFAHMSRVDLLKVGLISILGKSANFDTWSTRLVCQSIKHRAAPSSDVARAADWASRSQIVVFAVSRLVVLASAGWIFLRSFSARATPVVAA